MSSPMNTSFQTQNFACAVVFWKVNTCARLKRSVVVATLHLMVRYHMMFQTLWLSILWIHSWASIARLPKMKGLSCEAWVLCPFKWVVKWIFLRAVKWNECWRGQVFEHSRFVPAWPSVPHKGSWLVMLQYCNCVPGHYCFLVHLRLRVQCKRTVYIGKA